MWQWKVSEEGENQGSSSTVDSKQSGRAGGGPTTGKEQSPRCGWQTDWGPGLDDKGTLLRKLRAHQRNEERTGGGAGGEGAGARPRVDTKQEPAERAR